MSNKCADCGKEKYPSPLDPDSMEHLCSKTHGMIKEPKTVSTSKFKAGNKETAKTKVN